MALSLPNYKKQLVSCIEIENLGYIVMKLRNPLYKKNKISECMKEIVSDNKAGKLNFSDEDLGSTSSQEIDDCICLQNALCRSILNELKLLDEEPEEITEEEDISVCKDRSTSNSESGESVSTSTDQSSNESFSGSPPYYSTCYDIKVTESSAERLLNHLPKTPCTDKNRKYWEMMLHCERAAFRKAEANLPLPSREARFYWHLYSTAAKNSPLYQKEVNHALQTTLLKLINSQQDKKCISFWDQLIRLKSFDIIGRKNLINRLVKFLCVQSTLVTICLEGLFLKPDEGIRLLLALRNSRKTMKHVYCWRAFEKMVYIDEPVDESRSNADKQIKKFEWFLAIGSLKFLTTLSVNYTYIATNTGDLLILLAKKLGRSWKWLQLLCVEEDIIQKSNGGFKIVTDVIPDDAWKKAHFLAPKLKVQYAIIGIPTYNIHKLFFSKNTRIHTFALSTGVDLKFQQPWYLNCTFKTLYAWYSHSLVYLCLQLWHNRENLDNQLKKLLVSLPSLRVFEFMGEIRKLKTLCVMCLQIRCCSCNIHCINMQLQEAVHDKVDKETWIRSVKYLMICFEHDFEKRGVTFNIDFYCW